MDHELYLGQLVSWKSLLTQDHSASIGYSAMAYVNATLGLTLDKNVVFSIGVVLFLTSLWSVRVKRTTEVGLLQLNSILLWMVLFNHKAESPTFIIAMAGVALWFVQAHKHWLSIGLLVLAMVFTSLSPTEVYPAAHRELFVKPCILKAMPCFYVWLFIVLKQFELGGILPGWESRIVSLPKRIVAAFNSRFRFGFFSEVKINAEDHCEFQK